MEHASPGASSTARRNGEARAAKKAKYENENTEAYSEAVRARLEGGSRTGHACDRCKERKMKCDSNPESCKPCREKNLQCMTTDRTSRLPVARGQLGRYEQEMNMLKQRLAQYESRYGTLEHSGLHQQQGHVQNSPTNNPYYYLPPLGASMNQDTASPVLVKPAPTLPAPSALGPDRVYYGPVHGTMVDVMGSRIDIAEYPNPEVDSYNSKIMNRFNGSRTSVLNTMGGKQKIEDPHFLPMEEALHRTEIFFDNIWPFGPVVHKSTFRTMIQKYYEDPSSVSTAEIVQFAVIQAIIAEQMATRNRNTNPERCGWHPSHRDASNTWLHYGLGFYNDLLHEQSLASMQALSLFTMYCRMIPKPAYSWSLSNEVMLRAIELNYHRNPEKLELPTEEADPLSREMRVRVWWSILALVVTVGFRTGTLSPWQSQTFDVPLPQALLDEELTAEGISTSLSGKCDYLMAIHICHLLPILSDMHQNILIVRGSAEQYTQTAQEMDARILKWREDWELSTNQEPSPKRRDIQSLHLDHWTAEYQLMLHHPSIIPPTARKSRFDECLTKCHAACLRMAETNAKMTALNAVDRSWHSVGAFTLAFGIVLQISQRQLSTMTLTRIKDMHRELRTWLSIMWAVDMALGTNEHLLRIFEPLVRQLEQTSKIQLTWADLDNDLPGTKSLPMHSHHASRLEVHEGAHSIAHPPQSHQELYPGYDAAQVQLQDHYHNVHPPMIYHPPMMPSEYHEPPAMDHHSSQNFQFDPVYEGLPNSSSQAPQYQSNTSSIMSVPAYENTSPHTQIPTPAYYNLPTNPTPLNNTSYQQPRPEQDTLKDRHPSFAGHPAIALAQTPMQPWPNPYTLPTEQIPVWPTQWNPM